jgi:thiol-disulfide isomerase/thioredoxin
VSRLPAALLIAAAACAHEQAETVRIRAGSALAMLPDHGVDGTPVPDVTGKVVMVSFIATYCFPCVADLPVMEKMQKELGPKGYVTVAVGMDLEGPKVLRPFAQEYGLPYPLLMAPAELRDGRTAFGRISELPTRFLFDREGKLLMAFSGVADPKALMDTVRQAVEAKP